MNKNQLLKKFPNFFDRPVLRERQVYEIKGDKFILDSMDNNGNSLGVGFLWVRKYDEENSDIPFAAGPVVGAINVVTYECFPVTNVDDFRGKIETSFELAKLYHHTFPNQPNIFQRMLNFLLDVLKRKR